MSASAPEPTPADAMAVGQAAAAAAAAPAPGETPEQAARQAVDTETANRNIAISDADKQQIARMSAEMASAMTVDQLRKAGAMEPPPQPVSPPSQPAQPESQSPAREEGEPRKKSWAERHGFGG